jgi:hypothetical protein
VRDVVADVADHRRASRQVARVAEQHGGTFKADTGTVQGRLRCKKGCLVRGKFSPTCTGDATYWYCTGPAGKPGAGCTGSGYVYRDVFEGTWECGPGAGGVLGFGQR